MKTMTTATPPMKLDNAALGRLPPAVRGPAYDRRTTTEGILHIGVGGFHRAHQAVYVDDAIAATGDGRWAICGVGLLAHDSRMRDALVPQDCLYAMIERGPGADPQARVVGSLTGFLFAPGNAEAVLEKMASADTHIVSLTITEGGYYLDPKTGGPRLDHPDIVRDLQAPTQPSTAFGYLAEALDRRRRQGLKPFTVLSCDNVQGNGDVTRRLLLAVAGHRDAQLRDWIAQNGAFPNSMVDRITPATTDADREAVRDTFGIDDAWPVVTEPFRQWVVEDRFCDGRPPWDGVGVQMTADVRPYEMMKIRLLNASHSAMGYLGLLSGFAHIHEIMADPLFRRFVIEFMNEEVTPILEEVPGIDLGAYKAALVDRFSNPAIKDQVLRICMDGSSKIPKFVLPTLSEQLSRGGPTKRLSLVIASWCRAMAGTDDQGAPIAVADPMAAQLSERARASGRDPRAFLAVREVFGEDLPQSAVFVDQVRDALESLHDLGARKTLAKY
ncbi:MAG: mannitol dehydrogenase family protein [Rhodospirillaceae bacterium]|nr:mannitol dehydrogenase family protein [Rhodospirillaceae bacterium]